MQAFSKPLKSVSSDVHPGKACKVAEGAILLRIYNKHKITRTARAFPDYGHERCFESFLIALALRVVQF